MSRPTISETNLSRLNRFSGSSTDDKIGQALLQLSLAEKERKMLRDVNRKMVKNNRISTALALVILVLVIVM